MLLAVATPPRAMPAAFVSGLKLKSRTLDELALATYEAAIASTESGSVGGQYAVAFATWDAATFSTTRRGPGVSGIPLSWSSCGPRLPAMFSQTVIVPVPGLTAQGRWLSQLAS